MVIFILTNPIITHETDTIITYVSINMKKVVDEPFKESYSESGNFRQTEIIKNALKRFQIITREEIASHMY